MITYAMDYDRTYTMDPEGHDAMIALLKSRGHRVYIVTQRSGNGHDSVCLENRKELAEATANANCRVIFTEGAAKEWHMLRKEGIKVDIWIDDDLRSVSRGK